MSAFVVDTVFGVFFSNPFFMWEGPVMSQLHPYCCPPPLAPNTSPLSTKKFVPRVKPLGIDPLVSSPFGSNETWGRRGQEGAGEGGRGWEEGEEEGRKRGGRGGQYC